MNFSDSYYKFIHKKFMEQMERIDAFLPFGQSEFSTCRERVWRAIRNPFLRVGRYFKLVGLALVGKVREERFGDDF